MILIDALASLPLWKQILIPFGLVFMIYALFISPNPRGW